MLQGKKTYISLVVILLTHFAPVFTEDESFVIANSLVQLFAVLFAFYGRYSVKK